jgi:AsmA protein
MISIERGRDGKFNFEKPEGAKGTFPTPDLAKVSLSDGTLLYTDKQSGKRFEAGNCNLDMSRLRLLEGKSSDLSKSSSFTAEFACREIRAKTLTVSDLKFSVDGKDGVFDLKPVTMRFFGGQGSGSIRADFSGSVPLYHVHYSLLKFRIEEFLKALSPKKVAEGSMDFSANVSMQGKTMNEIKRTANGEASLHGENLTLNGSDLDGEFSRYESSQSFNLVDMGAFFFAGPFGLAVTKGYNFASNFQGSGGSSTIRTLVSDWKIERGVAQAKDVAMATNENRIALKGGLDFVNERFDDVTVALIDAKGCPRVQQKIRGSFRNPVVEKPSVLRSLAGPALKLLKQARDLFRGQCEIFYAGSVAPPK